VGVAKKKRRGPRGGGGGGGGSLKKESHGNMGKECLYIYSRWGETQVVGARAAVLCSRGLDRELLPLGLSNVLSQRP